MKIVLVTACFYCALFSKSYAQYQPSIYPAKNSFSTKKTIISAQQKGNNIFFNYSKNKFGKIVDKPIAFSNVSASYTLDHWGWFCRQEYQFEKVTKIPLAFRLGSKTVVDEMEGKFSSKANAVNFPENILYR